MLTGVIVIVVAAILVGVYVSWRAGRLDRLHARVEAARAALDAALVRLLRLSGGAPWPEFFEIDESLVDGDSTGRGADMPHLTASDPPPAQAG